MNVARRRVLQLLGAGAATIAVPTLALAMGPTSAPQLPGGKVPAPNSDACGPAENPCRTPRRRSRRRHSSHHRRKR